MQFFDRPLELNKTAEIQLLNATHSAQSHYDVEAHRLGFRNRIGMTDERVFSGVCDIEIVVVDEVRNTSSNSSPSSARDPGQLSSRRPDYDDPGLRDRHRSLPSPPLRESSRARRTRASSPTRAYPAATKIQIEHDVKLPGCGLSAYPYNTTHLRDSNKLVPRLRKSPYSHWRPFRIYTTSASNTTPKNAN